ncbi:hypothetical protein ScPMuIL_011758 [Solemya velum]
MVNTRLVLLLEENTLYSETQKAQDYEDMYDINFYDSEPRYPLPYYETEANDLINNFADKIQDDMEVDPGVDSLTYGQVMYVRGRLKGLYNYLVNNPNMLNRRFQVSNIKPKMPHMTPIYKEAKRSYQFGTAQPACPYRSSWRRITYAHDINDTLVEVYQPKSGSEGHQWFYTVTCDVGVKEDPRCPRCCRGINHHRYSSMCISKKSYVMAMVRKPYQRKYDWNWIQVDTSCNCAIKEKRRG